MSVEEAEAIALRYNLAPIIEQYLSPQFIKKVTVRLKGFQPRESIQETLDHWYQKNKSSILLFKELYEIFAQVADEIKPKLDFTKQEAFNGLIGAFRFVQKKHGFEPNMNGFKFGAIQTLLRY